MTKLFLDQKYICLILFQKKANKSLFGPSYLASQAMFKITLDVPSQLVALSNMPIIEEKVDGDLKTISYQESPIMSTYLVAIVVGLFDYVEHLTSDGKKNTLCSLFLVYNLCS